MPPLNREESSFWRSRFDSEESFQESFQDSDPSGDKRSSISCSRKTVCFDEKVKVEFVLNSADYTEVERNGTWYSKEDNERTRQDVLLTINLFEQSPSLIDEVTRTSRGIECRLKKQTTIRRSLKERTWKAVLEEQQYQNTLGLRDCIRLAKQSCNISKTAIQKGLEIAAIDYAEALKYQNEQCKIIDFDDSWIREVATEDRFPGFMECDNSIVDANDDSGFDDSWLRDISDVCVCG